jgi:hypothetical protein
MTGGDRLAAVAAFVASVAAVTVLTIMGKDVTALVGLVTPVIAGGWAVNEVRKTRNEQAPKLAEIAENVNGKLDARIKSAVTAALNGTE